MKETYSARPPKGRTYITRLAKRKLAACWMAGSGYGCRGRDNEDGEREADFIPCVVWRKQAENCAEYIGKGSLVAVDGRMQVRTWEQDGQRRYITEVVADSVRFLEKRKQTAEPAADQYGTGVAYDEDIPF